MSPAGATALTVIAALLTAPAAALAATPLERAAEKVVKLYGSGGLAGIEAYQTGVVISREGHILTANSLVLDQGEVTVVRHDGARYSGKVLGADPFADVAVIKIDPAGDPLAAFELRDAPIGQPGQTVFALSNLFGIATGDEPVSRMRGVIATTAPLSAWRGAIDRVDGGDVYILDAVTSNPGAAGGAVVDGEGRLLGMLGRELRSRVTGAWLSYASPAAELRTPVERILQGHSSAGSVGGEEPPPVDLLAAFGFALTPDIVPRTPPYVDYVKPGGAAEAAGLKPDDLIVTVDGLVTGSGAELRRILSRKIATLSASEGDSAALPLFVQRGEEFIEVKLNASKPAEAREP